MSSDYYQGSFLNIEPGIDLSSVSCDPNLYLPKKIIKKLRKFPLKWHKNTLFYFWYFVQQRRFNLPWMFPPPNHAPLLLLSPRHQIRDAIAHLDWNQVNPRITCVNEIPSIWDFVLWQEVDIFWMKLDNATCEKWVFIFSSILKIWKSITVSGVRATVYETPH